MADDIKTSSTPTASGKVGYCRPPVGRPFRKGQSGNPSGRPKGSRNRARQLAQEDQLGALIREEAYRLIKTDADGGETKMPAARVVIRSLILAAAKGDLKAQAAFLNILREMPDNSATLGSAPDDKTRDAPTQEPQEIVFRIVDPTHPKPEDRLQGIRAGDIAAATRRVT